MKKKAFLVGIFLISALALMTASASPSDYIWPDTNTPFSEEIEVCSHDPVPDTVKFLLPSDSNKTTLTVKLESGTWLEAGGPKVFNLFKSQTSPPSITSFPHAAPSA